MKQYPYISPETQYSTGLPIPGGMTSREACQSAAEEAFFADYRPLRAGFAEDYVDNASDEVEGEMTFDFANGIMQVPMSRGQLVELLKTLAGTEIETPEPAEKKSKQIMELISTKRRRYIKMKNHKRRKL
jgi:hypothetical protein